MVHVYNRTSHIQIQHFALKSKVYSVILGIIEALLAILDVDKELD